MDLLHKKVKRKSSDTLWKVTAINSRGIWIVQHSKQRFNSRCIKPSTFRAKWEVVEESSSEK